MSNPRLMQVMLAAGDGGAETFFEKLAIAFQERSVQQCLVIAKQARRRERLEAVGCEVIEVQASGLARLFLRQRIARIARRWDPSLMLGWMNRASSSLPVIDGVVNVARLGGYYNLKYYRTCRHLIGNTPGIVRYLKDEGWPEMNAHLISNFGEVPDAPDARGLRSELGIQETQKVILTLGRLHKAKAQDTLIRGMKSLPECVLLIAGEGDLRSPLEQLAKDEGVDGRVRFLGWRSDTANLWQTADLCVFPSRFEPLGNVVLEAWSYGVPLVAAASDGPSWLVDDGENGLLFPVDDVDAMVRQTRALLENVNLGQALVAGGRRKYAREFSVDVIVGRYLELFARIGN